MTFRFAFFLTLAYLYGSNAGVRSTSIPDPDGNFHVFQLPIGQGDAYVLQCPSGRLSFFDLGSSENAFSGFWRESEIRTFIGSQFSNIKNIFITHNHYDHYSLIPGTFADTNSLENIYTSCTADHAPTLLRDWIQAENLFSKIKLFNDGNHCGANGVSCNAVDLCPLADGVTSVVLSANAGQHCESGNKNIDSIVLKVTFNKVSILMTGDFEDETSSASENGAQKQLVDFYGDDLQSTVFIPSHHTASRLANKRVLRDAIKPKALMTSANPWYRYGHPRCLVLHAFRDYVRTLCKPTVTDPNDEFYCGAPLKLVSSEEMLQTTYTCGHSSSNTEEITDNEYAIYTSTPKQGEKKLVEFMTNGDKWNFKVTPA